ncbi:protein kinase [Streptomyces sp. NPDC001594]|uniref:serine/threonine-protein kinase n=1 Tax=Streptomyces sp. NPDC001594 TaxID=3364590 RepID=UPI0036945AC8
MERRIGAGGMGVVYLALSPSGRRVALKVIRQEFAYDADYRARFRNEIQAARQVSGAFTAPVVGADAEADPPWMATQYFDAPTLAEQIGKEGPLGEEAVWRLGRGLAEALRDIHRAGLVHRDLKPSNVLLTEDGPRVIDFGIARVLNATPLTRSGSVLGTISFMAPEQLSTPRHVGPAADVFALGGVLAYASTGRGPFDGGTGTPPIAVAMKIVQDEPDLDGMASPVRAVVEQCLHKEPAERPSPAELLILLQGDGTGTAGPMSRLRKPTVSPAGASGRTQRRPGKRAYVLASVVLAGAAVPMMWAIGPGGDRGEAKAPPPATASTPPAGPAMEPVAALRPQGWALWERGPTDPDGKHGQRPMCGSSGDVLLCSDDNTAERIDKASGQVMWHEAGHVVGLAQETVLVSDKDQSTLMGFDAKTGRRLWSVAAISPGWGYLHVGASTVLWRNGNRIERRDLRTGKVLATRSIPGMEWNPFEGEDGTLLLLDRHSDGKALTTSIALLDPVTLDTGKVITTLAGSFETLAADRNSLTFLANVMDAKNRSRVGQDLVRITVADGRVTRAPLQDTPSANALVQGDRLYLSRADGRLTTYDMSTSHPTWTVETGSDSPALPVVADGRLYSLAGNGRITCVDVATGKVLWRSAARRDLNMPAGGGGLQDHPEFAVMDRVVYAGADTGAVFAVAPPGR